MKKYLYEPIFREGLGFRGDILVLVNKLAIGLRAWAMHQRERERKKEKVCVCAREREKEREIEQ